MSKPEMPQARTYRYRAPAKFRVRCLGPGKEHFFRSVDPVKNRICFSCAKKMAELRVTQSYPDP